MPQMLFQVEYLQSLYNFGQTTELAGKLLWFEIQTKVSFPMGKMPILHLEIHVLYWKKLFRNKTHWTDGTYFFYLFSLKMSSAA